MPPRGGRGSRRTRSATCVSIRRRRASSTAGWSASSSSVSDPPLRERLLIAIDGKGAFRRFKDVLLAFPAERERWFAYRSELLHFHIQTWLDHMRIEVANQPPWGHVAQPAEPAEIPRVVPSGEAPGEILRRQARDLLDEIPAAELPPALAFLEFLRDRGPSSLLGARGAARVVPPLDDDDDDDDDDDRPEPAVGAR